MRSSAVRRCPSPCAPSSPPGRTQPPPRPGCTAASARAACRGSAPGAGVGAAGGRRHVAAPASLIGGVAPWEISAGAERKTCRAPCGVASRPPERPWTRHPRGCWRTRPLPTWAQLLPSAHQGAEETQPRNWAGLSWSAAPLMAGRPRSSASGAATLLEGLLAVPGAEIDAWE